MKAKKWLAGGVLSLAVAFSFAALYRPQTIEVRGTLAEVDSHSNELKEIGLRKPDGTIVKFNVASLGLVAGGNIDLAHNVTYRAESNESLLDKIEDAVLPRSVDFGDWQYKASTFGIAPQTKDAITTGMPGVSGKDPMEGMDMSGMDMSKPKAPEHNHP